MICPRCMAEVPYFRRRLEDDPVDDRPYECPSCGHGVPAKFVRSYAFRPPAVFPVVGLRAHGKTVYLATLLKTLLHDQHQDRHWRRLLVQEVVANQAFEELKHAAALLDRGVQPEGTQIKVSFAEPAIVRVEGLPGLLGSRHWLLFDNQGEVFSDSEQLVANAHYALRSPVATMFVSTKQLATEGGGFGNQFVQMLGTFRRAQEENDSARRPARQSLLIVVTKADELLERLEFQDPKSAAESDRQLWAFELLRDYLTGDDPDLVVRGLRDPRMRRLSQAVRIWLGTIEGVEMALRTLHKNYRDVEYCVVSSYGRTPIDGEQQGDYRPRGELVPLFWALRLNRPPGPLRWLWDRLTGAVLPRALGAWETARTERGRDSLRLAGKVALAALLLGATVTGFQALRQRAQRTAPYVRSHFDSLIANGRLWLPEGDFVYRERLVLDHSVTIEGSGVGLSRLHCPLGIRVQGNARLEAHDLAIESGTTDDALLTAAGSSSLRLRRCQLIGGAQQQSPGVGVRLQDKAQATLQTVELTGHQTGVVAIDEAQLKMIESRVWGNAGMGLSLEGQSMSELSRVLCEDNGQAGLRLTAKAAATLNDCRFQENRQAGAVFASTGKIVAEGLAALDNHGHGFLVEGSAKPRLSRSLSEHNRQDGLVYRQHAGGQSIGNELSRNLGWGIRVWDQAAPSLTDNICRRNRGGSISLKSSGYISQQNNR